MDRDPETDGNARRTTGDAADADSVSDADGRGPRTDDAPLVRRAPIAREQLDDQAVFVVRRLQQEGHEAYLVGGCVRDLLSGLEPKDFDVATDAQPNRIKRLFRSARVIGRRFRLVHIRFPGDHVVETATFRGDPTRRATPPPGKQRRGERTGSQRRRPDWRDSVENIFGTAPEDARRRDFTINALFYDPVRGAVIDYVGGLADLEGGVIRSIGEPSVRIREDPVRMLRAVHFARRMDFVLEPQLETAIREQAGTLDGTSHARLYIELIKILTRGRARETLLTLFDLGVLRVWLPELCEGLEEPATWPTEGGGTHEEASRGEPEVTTVAHATWNLLGAADRWGLAAHDAPEALALAVLFGPWLLESWRRQSQRGLTAFLRHMEANFRPIALRMSVARHVVHRLTDILWLLPQFRHPPPQPKQRRKVLHRPAFFDGLTFFELDLSARDADDAPVDMWREAATEAGVRRDERRARFAHGKRPPAGDRARSGRRGRRGGRGRRGQPRGPRRGGLTPEADAWSPPPDPNET